MRIINVDWRWWWGKKVRAGQRWRSFNPSRCPTRTRPGALGLESTHVSHLSTSESHKNFIDVTSNTEVIPWTFSTKSHTRNPGIVLDSIFLTPSAIISPNVKKQLLNQVLHIFSFDLHKKKKKPYKVEFLSIFYQKRSYFPERSGKFLKNTGLVTAGSDQEAWTLCPCSNTHPSILSFYYPSIPIFLCSHKCRLR